MNRVTVTALTTGALVLACATAFPATQDYPTRPITMIVPYPPGGGVDVMGRLIGQKLSVALGQQVVIENRGGAGGMIGTRDAAKAAPDGYTIVMLLTGISLGANTGYDVNKDFAPIGIVASTPIIVDANPALPARSLSDVIALAKKEPGKLAAGTPPAPTINYFAAELFNLMAGTDITVVTYKGTGPLTNDLLGNHVSLGFNTIPASVSNIAAGQLRGLAVAAPVRSAALPDVPTAAQSGLPGFEAVQYYVTRTADDEGFITEDSIAYYMARVRGGTGLITVEMASPEKVGRHRRREVGIYDDRFIPGLTRLVGAIHGGGAKASIQLGHAGGHTRLDISGETPIAPSAVPHPVYDDIRNHRARGDDGRAHSRNDCGPCRRRAARAGGGLRLRRNPRGPRLSDLAIPCAV